MMKKAYGNDSSPRWLLPLSMAENKIQGASFCGFRHEDGIRAVTSLLPHHTYRRPLELSTDLTCIVFLHGGSSVVLGPNSRSAC
ncbi:hypothetical protein TNCV_52151 [Trichonephila clavipes]|nr:hypothetical protein TNCV_52151 [Trichonephila clavipes]